MTSEVKFAWKIRVSAEGKFDPSTLLKFVSEDELVEKLTASHLSEADNFSSSSSEEKIEDVLVQVLKALRKEKSYALLFLPNKDVLIVHFNGGVKELLSSVEANGVVLVKSREGEEWRYGDWDCYMANCTDFLHECIIQVTPCLKGV